MVVDEVLLLVLFALYAHECLVKQRAGEFLFFGRPRGCRSRSVPMWSLASGNGYSLVSLVPSSGSVFRSDGGSFDWKSAERRRDEWRAETPMLRVLCGVLFLVVFGGVVLLSALGAWAAWWPVFAAAGIGAWLAVVIECGQVIARLYKLPFRQAVARLGTLMLSPITAMRALDVASAPLFADFHPVVTAFAVCAPAEFHQVSRAYLFSSSTDDVATRVRRCLEKMDALEAVEAPPAREEGAVRYCPRCSSQFSREAATCNECDGVELREWRVKDGGSDLH